MFKKIQNLYLPLVKFQIQILFLCTDTLLYDVFLWKGFVSYFIYYFICYFRKQKYLNIKKNY